MRSLGIEPKAWVLLQEDCPESDNISSTLAASCRPTWSASASSLRLKGRSNKNYNTDRGNERERAVK